MTTTEDVQRRRAARLAGLLYLLTLVTVIVTSYGVVWPLTGGVGPAEAARNVLAHETQFRVGITLNALYAVELMVLGVALHVVLRRVDEMLALLALAGRLAHAFVWTLVVTNLFGALQLLTQPDVARALPPDELPVLARLTMSGFDRYYVALLFWSLGSIAAAWGWLRSREVPRALAAYGLGASAWAAFCTVCLFVDPRFQQVVGLSWFDLPLLLFEVALGALLLFRGLPRSATTR